MEALTIPAAFKSLHHQLDKLPLRAPQKLSPMLLQINQQIALHISQLPDTPANRSAKKQAVALLSQYLVLAQESRLTCLPSANLCESILLLQTAVEIMLESEDAVSW